MKSPIRITAVTSASSQHLHPRKSLGKRGTRYVIHKHSVVEDFAPFRNFIRSALGERADVQVVCEVTDGLEAVQKAEELKPDLILLDIGLPTLNGIEAARQIRKLAPESKIIFLTQESSPVVMQEASSLGSWGYVLKCRAASDLSAAVEAAILGERVVGSA